MGRKSDVCGPPSWGSGCADDLRLGHDDDGALGAEELGAAGAQTDAADFRRTKAGPRADGGDHCPNGNGSGRDGGRARAAG